MYFKLFFCGLKSSKNKHFMKKHPLCFRLSVNYLSSSRNTYNDSSKISESMRCVLLIKLLFKGVDKRCLQQT